MRKPTEEELRAIANLLTIPIEEREPFAASQRAVVSIGQKLPVIHQVLFW